MPPTTTPWYGADWNPEQWPEPVWREDAALMRQAGVNLATVGVFAWAKLEPEPGRYTFDWLDRVLEVAHEAGVRVNLATPTASPPPWFTLAHPDALPVTADGVRLVHGSRDTYCAAAPAYRDAARAIAAALAQRYRDHPALAMWHVHNEYGTICYCDHAAAAFRRWLRHRYGDLSALNAAWGTAFWGQHYSAWEQVLPPRATQYLPNPHQALDFRRFWSDELCAAYREQRDVLRAATPAVPITTNYAVGEWVPVDHRRFSAAVDLVALDAYPEGAGVAAAEHTAFLADLARHWAGGRPWLLMEQAPGALRQGRVQVATAPGELARLSLSHLARGSTGVMFFQWRASAAGAEQYHAAVVPHAGPRTRIFAEACELGAVLPRLAEVCADPQGGAPAGTGGRRPAVSPEAATPAVVAPVAIAWDAESWWALRAPHLPSDRLDYLAALRRAHGALWRRQVTCDFADLAADLTAYRLVLVPSHYLVGDAAAASVRRYVAAGGHLVVWYFSGIADPSGRVRLGGYPGAFRDVLGVRVAEFHPLPPGETVPLDDGTPATVWAERVELHGAEPLLRYAAGPLEGLPALTRHRFGAGTAWYVASELAAPAYGRLLDQALAAAGVSGAGLPAGVEVVTRRRGGTGWRFVLNHTDREVRVPGSAVDLISGARAVDHRVAPGGCAVLRTDEPSE